MCELTEKWKQEGIQEKARKVAINLAQTSMPAEQITEIVEVGVNLVQQWIGGALVT